MACGLSYLKRFFRRRVRDGSSNAVGGPPQKAIGAHHHSASPPSVEEKDEEAEPFAELSEVACPPPIANPDERRLYKKEFLEDRNVL